MGTTTDKLNYLNTTKDNIRTGMIDRGLSVPTSTPFRSYGDLIKTLPHKNDLKCVIGLWTGGSSSVKTFTVEGLPFKPKGIFVVAQPTADISSTRDNVDKLYYNPDELSESYILIDKNGDDPTDSYSVDNLTITITSNSISISGYIDADHSQDITWENLGSFLGDRVGTAGYRYIIWG